MMKQKKIIVPILTLAVMLLMVGGVYAVFSSTQPEKSKAENVRDTTDQDYEKGLTEEQKAFNELINKQIYEETANNLEPVSYTHLDVYKRQYTDHPTYGKQFKVESFEEKAPEDEEAIERYLGSGAIRGIGLALAARIVRRFKADTFRIIEEEPERLAEVKGISERKAMEIADQVNEKRDLRQAMIFLQQYGITMNLAVKVYQQYGQEVYGCLLYTSRCV